MCSGSLKLFEDCIPCPPRQPLARALEVWFPTATVLTVHDSLWLQAVRGMDGLLLEVAGALLDPRLAIEHIGAIAKATRAVRANGGFGAGHPLHAVFVGSDDFSGEAARSFITELQDAWGPDLASSVTFGWVPRDDLRTGLRLIAERAVPHPTGIQVLLGSGWV